MLFALPLFLVISQCACKDLVPVIIWGEYDKPAIEGDFPGLSQLRSYHFSQLLHKLIGKRPHVLLFTEENLSIEDFSWRNDDDQSSFPNLQNISASNKDFLYLPSVESPISVFHQLTHHGYSFANYDKGSPPLLSLPSVLIAALPEPGPHDTRPALLRFHDEYMTSVAFEAIQKYKSVLVAYTGRHASYIEPSTSRLRREAEDENMSNGDEIVMTDEDNTIYLVTASPIEFRQGENATYFTQTAYVSKETSKGDIIKLDVKFKEESISFDFNFNAGENQAWQLVDVLLEGPPNIKMTTKTFIGAPYGHSFFCASAIRFEGQSATGEEYVVILRQLQAQPRVINREFGLATDCVPYFTVQIWSGLLIGLLLFAVAMMSILFILDIHTMDRFDDPKGKIITIPNE